MNEVTTRIQELQNEINDMFDSRDVEDAESVRSAQSHVNSQPEVFTPVRDPSGMLNRSLGYRDATMGRQVFGTRMVIRETFLHIQRRLLLITQAERMVNRTGKPVEEIIGIDEEREISSAQIRTLYFAQKRTIITEYYEKIGHHELQAAQAEQERRIRQGELLRQQQDFREVLEKMKELKKFKNCSLDELTRQKFIEDQKIIMEFSGRLQ